MARSSQAQRRLAALLAETRSIVRRKRRKLGPTQLAELGALLAEGKEALASGDRARIEQLIGTLEAAAKSHRFSELRKSLAREYVEVIVLAAIAALALRFVVAESFRIPSGSMAPTLQPGDVVLVDKLAYGLRLPFVGALSSWGEPALGDVVVFRSPADPGVDLIKRVVGVGGDQIEIVEEQLVVNGVHQPRRLVQDRYDFWNYRNDLQYWHPQSGELYVEELAGRRHATLHSRTLPRPRPKEGPFLVPDGHVFVLGDSRDDSDDGRSDGGWYVPLEAIKGRARWVVFSWSYGGSWFWGEEGVIFGRLLRRIDAPFPTTIATTGEELTGSLSGASVRP